MILKTQTFPRSQFMPAVGRVGNAVSIILCSYSKDLRVINTIDTCNFLKIQFNLLLITCLTEEHSGQLQKQHKSTRN